MRELLFITMNIQEIIEKLREIYKTDALVGDALGISQPTVFRLRKGKTKTSFDTGLKIIQLGKRHGITTEKSDD